MKIFLFFFAGFAVEDYEALFLGAKKASRTGIYGSPSILNNRRFFISTRQQESPTSADSGESAFDKQEKLISELMLATNIREEERVRLITKILILFCSCNSYWWLIKLENEIRAALQGGLPPSNPQLMKARQTYQDVVSGITSSMRQRLTREAQSTGADDSIGWNPGFTYLGIFAVISILVVLGGKGIFYWSYKLFSNFRPNLNRMIMAESSKGDDVQTGENLVILC